MELKQNIPIYIQIMEATKTYIANGQLSPGEKLRSVRELALEWKVNPNTVQRAMAELEREGYLDTQRTSGRFVTENKERIEQLKIELSQNQVILYIEELKKLNFTKADAIKLIEKFWDDTGR